MHTNIYKKLLLCVVFGRTAGYYNAQNTLKTCINVLLLTAETNFKSQNFTLMLMTSRVQIEVSVPSSERASSGH